MGDPGALWHDWGQGPGWGELTDFQPSPSALVCHSAPVGGPRVSGLFSASYLGALSLLQALGPPSSTQGLRSGRELRGRESGLALSPRAPLGPPGSQPFLWASPGLLSGRVQPERADLSLGLKGQIPRPRLFLLSPASRSPRGRCTAGCKQGGPRVGGSGGRGSVILGRLFSWQRLLPRQFPPPPPPAPPLIINLGFVCKQQLVSFVSFPSSPPPPPLPHRAPFPPRPGLPTGSFSPGSALPPGDLEAQALGSTWGRGGGGQPPPILGPESYVLLWPFKEMVLNPSGT